MIKMGTRVLVFALILSLCSLSVVTATPITSVKYKELNLINVSSKFVSSVKRTFQLFRFLTATPRPTPTAAPTPTTKPTHTINPTDSTSVLRNAKVLGSNDKETTTISASGTPEPSPEILKKDATLSSSADDAKDDDTKDDDREDEEEPSTESIDRADVNKKVPVESEAAADSPVFQLLDAITSVAPSIHAHINDQVRLENLSVKCDDAEKSPSPSPSLARGNAMKVVRTEIEDNNSYLATDPTQVSTSPSVSLEDDSGGVTAGGHNGGDDDEEPWEDDSGDWDHDIGSDGEEAPPGFLSKDDDDIDGWDHDVGDWDHDVRDDDDEEPAPEFSWGDEVPDWDQHDDDNDEKNKTPGDEAGTETDAEYEYDYEDE